MLRAARVVAARVHRQLESKIMVTGFSQGGQAASALAHALQHGVGSHLRLRAVAGISGLYDVQHAELPAALDGTLNPRLAAFYLAYWVTAMNRFHHLYANPSQAFRDPYDKTIPTLFDGLHSDTPGSSSHCFYQSAATAHQAVPGAADPPERRDPEAHPLRRHHLHQLGPARAGPAVRRAR